MKKYKNLKGLLITVILLFSLTIVYSQMPPRVNFNTVYLSDFVDEDIRPVSGTLKYQNEKNTLNSVGEVITVVYSDCRNEEFNGYYSIVETSETDKKIIYNTIASGQKTQFIFYKEEGIFVARFQIREKKLKKRIEWVSIFCYMGPDISTKEEGFVALQDLKKDIVENHYWKN